MRQKNCSDKKVRTATCVGEFLVQPFASCSCTKYIPANVFYSTRFSFDSTFWSARNLGQSSLNISPLGASPRTKVVLDSGIRCAGANYDRSAIVFHRSFVPSVSNGRPVSEVTRGSSPITIARIFAEFSTRPRRSVKVPMPTSPTTSHLAGSFPFVTEAAATRNPRISAKGVAS